MKKDFSSILSLVLEMIILVLVILCFITDLLPFIITGIVFLGIWFIFSCYTVANELSGGGVSESMLNKAAHSTFIMGVGFSMINNYFDNLALKIIGIAFYVISLACYGYTLGRNMKERKNRPQQ
ncbi:MAG: hypothetical protein LBS19_16255 [Clostridiales bacterium]|jgi:hypothetical protein|nr:hypothetical protein [Clostridiales bacterium]